MRRIFVAPDQLDGDSVTLDSEAHRHLARVLRAQPGDALVVFDGQGNEREAAVLEVGSKTTTLRLGARRPERAVVAPPITLLQAIPRGERMDWIVQKTCELGIARIVPVLSGRSVARPEASSSRHRRWETIAREAARQCGRADVPAIDGPLPLGEALAACDLAPLRLVLWEGSEGQPLRGVLATAATAATALLVGPEGGFAADEVAEANRAGFRTVGLGARILRVETAAVVAVALVQAAAGGLD